jgi:hypothetical protein
MEFADDAIFVGCGGFLGKTSAAHRGDYILSILSILSKNSNGILRGTTTRELHEVGGVGNPALPVGLIRTAAVLFILPILSILFSSLANMLE